MEYTIIKCAYNTVIWLMSLYHTMMKQQENFEILKETIMTF